jgi:hypothetical protein
MQRGRTLRPTAACAVGGGNGRAVLDALERERSEKLKPFDFFDRGYTEMHLERLLKKGSTAAAPSRNVPMAASSSAHPLSCR